MATEVRARLTAREGRRFGLTVGGVFLLLAAFARWRGHTLTPWILAGLGTPLVVAGLLLPGRLTSVYRSWMGLAQLLSRVTTPVFLALLYFLVLTPMGLLLRLFGRNPLRPRERDGSFWRIRSEQHNASSLTRQF